MNRRRIEKSRKTRPNKKAAKQSARANQFFKYIFQHNPFICDGNGLARLQCPSRMFVNILLFHLAS